MKRVIAVILILVMTLAFGLMAVGCDEENNSSEWIVGTSAPTNETKGGEGDLYLDGSTGEVYLCGVNGWTKLGAFSQSSNSDASYWYTGSGAPTLNDAEIGDFYIDKTNLVIYEKTQNGWVEVCEFKGEDKVVHVGGENGGNN